MTDNVRIAVYEMPERLTNGYCFGKGNPITFMNVDWFDAPRVAFEKVSANHGALRIFILNKRYIKPGRSYLVLSVDGDSMVIKAEAK